MLVASRVGNFDVVSLLLDRGADVNYQSFNKQVRKDLDLFPPFISHLFFFFFSFKFEDTALFAAIRAGHSRIVSLLLQKGAGVNFKNLVRRMLLFFDFFFTTFD